MAEAFDLNTLAGKFIVFDGPDGCGKTTQLKQVQAAAEKKGMPVLRLREPGGTPIGEQIRELLLSTKTEGMALSCEMLLYMASRAQLVEQEIKPALAGGKLVLSDRYASSTLAYQGGGGGMSHEAILAVAEIAVAGFWPDLTVIFDLPIEVAMRRIGAGTGTKSRKIEPALTLFSDRIEQRDQEYFERVRQSYLEQAKRWPERYRIVDASKSIKHVEVQVIETLQDFFAPKG